MQFLYRDEGDGDFHFMDNSSYEQVALDADLVGDATNYLIDNMEVNVAFFRERPIGITLPNFVVLEVVEAPPGEKAIRLRVHPSLLWFPQVIPLMHQCLFLRESC